MENIIIGPVGSGKTYKLLKLAHNTDKIIVCRDIEYTKTLYLLAKKEGFNIHYPITYNDLRKYLTLIKFEYLIDDLDFFFEYMYNIKITAVTIDK